MSTGKQELKTPEKRQNVGNTRQQHVMLPPVNIVENQDGITLTADMPGVSPDRLDVQVDDHVLSIEGNIEVELPPETQAAATEVRGDRYERRFSLSRELDDSKVEAHLDNGVLALRIPRREEHKPRRIEVRS